MTPQQRLDHLLADVWQPTDAVITLAVIRAALPAEAYGHVLFTLAMAKKPQADTMQAVAEAAEMEGVFIALNGSGISFSPLDRQQQIDTLATAGQWPTAVRDAVKALGGVYVKEWQRQGMAVEPTLESVQAEIDSENLATLRNNLQARFDAIKNQVGTSEQADAVAALRVMAEELE